MLATTRTASSLSPLFVAKRREAGGRRPSSSSSHDARKSPFFFFSSREGCLGRRRHHARKVRSSSSSSDDSNGEEEKNDDDDAKYDFIEEISDENLLTTSLNRAISDEDYSLAAKLSKRLQAVQNLNGARDAREILLDWRMLGIAEWMAARAEALGFRFPTGIQRKSTSAASFSPRSAPSRTSVTSSTMRQSSRTPSEAGSSSPDQAEPFGSEWA